jgi:hypothetical protein
VEPAVAELECEAALQHPHRVTAETDEEPLEGDSLLKPLRGYAFPALRGCAAATVPAGGSPRGSRRVQGVARAASIAGRATRRPW